MTYRTRECPACGGFDGATLFQQSFAKIEGVSILDGYHVVVCEQCGMLFADDIPGQPTFDAYYADASKYEYPQRAGTESMFDMSRFAEIANLIADAMPDRSARILDVGCATGGLLRELQRRGFTRLAGLDPSPACVRLAHARHGLDVRQGTIASLEAWGEQYDCIVLSGVLEHIRDVQRTLAILRSRLTPNGSLFIEVPDAWGFADFPDAPFQAFSTEHVNFFSLASLTHTLNVAGFAVTMGEENTREQTATVTMANVSVFAKRSDNRLLRVPDRGPRHAVTWYIDQCVRAEAAVRTCVRTLVADRQPVIVWGAGTFTQRLLATTQLREANLIGFADSNPRYFGRTLAGHAILSPETVRHYPTAPIVIASVPFAAEIRALIAELKLPNPVRTL